MDLAEGHVASIDFSDSGSHIINLGTGRAHSVTELKECVENAAGITISTSVKPRREGDLASVYADVSKAEELMGWRSKRSLEDACRDGWKWQQLNKRGYD
jgi:UDP-glucose 4-epimerase